MTKLLAFTIFVSCSISAFCLAMLAYTFSTGELPFGFQPPKWALEVPAVTRERKTETKESGEHGRFEEEYLRGFYNELLNEKEKISDEKKKLSQDKRDVQEIMRQAREMQVKIEQTENRIKKILFFIDKTEKKNIQDLSKLISGMEAASGAKMLNELDENMAARVLFYMNQKMASQLVSEILKTANDTQIKRIKRITAKLQVMTDQKPVFSEEGSAE